MSVLIWTTTPWTIPSNLAIAFHPEFDYGAYDVDGRTVIVAEALAERVSQAVGRPFGTPIARMKGEQLEGIRFRHPLYERESMECSATMSRSKRARGPSTPRPAMAPTTS